VPTSRRSLTPSTRLDLASRLRPLQGALRSRLSRVDVLAEVTRSVNATLDPERVADAIVAHAGEWLPVPAWVVFALDHTGARAFGSRGLPSALEAAAEAVGQWVLKHGETCTAADVSTDRRFGAGGEVSAVAFPLECRGRVVAALVGLDRMPASRQPSIAPATEAALRRALEPGGFALDNAIRVERAEALSVTDDLTQLYNSRYLGQVLRRETKRASRNGRPLSLLFVDLDGFKSVNDSHGHLCGSRALVEAAALIRQSARETDVVARFGGDEFALILPDTGSEGAAAVGERVRERINGHGFLEGDGLAIRLTVSVGVATLPDVAASAEGLIQAADRAMYYIKDRGKNGLHIAGTGSEERT
jgi:diguanylate cyclase (GGDEF)-like protein